MCPGHRQSAEQLRDRKRAVQHTHRGGKAEGDRLAPTEASVCDAVKALLAKVSVRADEALLAHFPKAWPARVIVQSEQGTRDKLVLAVPGDPGAPMDAIAV